MSGASTRDVRVRCIHRSGSRSPPAAMHVPIRTPASHHESVMTTTIRFHRYGGPEVLVPEDEQVGAPGAGQVRLRHDAIGVNFIDTAFRQGIFPIRTGWRCWCIACVRCDRGHRGHTAAASGARAGLSAGRDR